LISGDWSENWIATIWFTPTDSTQSARCRKVAARSASWPEPSSRLA